MIQILQTIVLIGLALPVAAQTPESRSETPSILLPGHNGGITGTGRGGATTVIPDHQGGGVILGRDGMTMIVPNGIGGFIAYGPSIARPGLRDTTPSAPRDLLGGTRPLRGESLRGPNTGLR